MKKILSIATLACLVLLNIPFVQAQSPGMIFTEIAAFEPSDTEWIELYNASNTSIDMLDYKLYENETAHKLTLYQGLDTMIEPGEYVIIANKADALLAKYPFLTSQTIFDSSWTSLNKSGEYIALMHQESILDQITFSESDTGSLQFITNQWMEIPNIHTIGQINSILTEPQEMPEEILPPSSEHVIFIDESIIPPTLLSPSGMPMGMVLVLTQAQDMVSEDNKFKPYSYMLYMLDQYNDTLSLTDYLKQLTDAFYGSTPTIPQDPQDPIIPQEPSSEKLPPTDPVLQDPIQEELPTTSLPPIQEPSDIPPPDPIVTEPTPTDTSDQYEEIPDEQMDEFEQSCLAWWENRMSVIE